MYRVFVWQGQCRRCFGEYKTETEAREKYELLKELGWFDSVELTKGRKRIA